MSRIASLSLLVLLIAGCGSKSAPAPTAPLPDESKETAKAEPEAKPEPEPEPPKAEPISVTLPASAVDVKLDKAGTGKKTPLKYVMSAGPAGGFDTEVALDADVSISTPEGQQSQKSTITAQFGYTTEVVEVAPDGTIKVKLQLASAKGSQTDPMNPAAPKAMEQELAPFIGTTIEHSLTSSGVAGDRVFTTPPVEDPSMMQFLTMMPQLAIVLPDKPVGKGATWTVTEPFPMPELKATVKTTYKLVSRKGNTATIEGKQTIEAAPDQQTSSQMTIKELKGSGTVKATIEDGKLVAMNEQSQSLTIMANTQGVDVKMVMSTRSVAKAK